MGLRQVPDPANEGVLVEGARSKLDLSGRDEQLIPIYTLPTKNHSYSLTVCSFCRRFVSIARYVRVTHFRRPKMSEAATNRKGAVFFVVIWPRYPFRYDFSATSRLLKAPFNSLLSALMRKLQKCYFAISDSLAHFGPCMGSTYYQKWMIGGEVEMKEI